MGVAFQCMVRLTVYAMSYELYVVEWYDGERCARTMLLIKCGFLVRKGQLNRHAQVPTTTTLHCHAKRTGQTGAVFLRNGP